MRLIYAAYCIARMLYTADLWRFYLQSQRIAYGGKAFAYKKD
jgi:hypothetical protein